ncbi:50S ribosomal protein L18 [Candidatus Woesearchaeota archaeon CG10_big_fil_rev_8_21_14_0_10_32_24]|nr:MAG: 50S ribosomal protein L18 [Candidatus Woesearchaeota archaeon CG10_big_fil_rev_8_21_14_0_10_32_24]
MATRKPKSVPFRRKKEGKTNYHRRLKILLSQKSRLVVRLTNQKVIVQIIQFFPEGDRVAIGMDSSALRELGWKYSLKNISAAYLTGLLIGKKAVDAKQEEVVFDSGNQSILHGGKHFAFLKGIVDSGLQIKHGDEKIFPSKERLTGAHVASYAKKLKSENQEKYNHVFGQYLKANAHPEDITKNFEEVKKKILG